MLSDVEKVLRLNKNALDEKAQLKSFAEQYGEYAIVRDVLREEGASARESAERIEEVTPFVLCLNGSVFGVEPLRDMPLVISAAAIKHIAKGHIDEYAGGEAAAYLKLTGFINGLAGEMMENVLVFQSPDPRRGSNYLFVLSSRSEHDNPITTVVQIDSQIKKIDVEKIVSSHGSSHLWLDISQTVARGCDIYVNERTGAWLLSQCALARPRGHGLRIGSPATDQAMESAGETTLPGGQLAALRHLSSLYSTAFPRSQDAFELSQAIAELETEEPRERATGGIGATREEPRPSVHRGFHR